jgi:CBS-domain-containing membrane protein
MRAADVMVRDVVTVHPETEVADAVKAPATSPSTTGSCIFGG